MQIDVGFGEKVTPSAIEIEYPTFLEFPSSLALRSGMVSPIHSSPTLVAGKSLQV
jgi:hypothetical protein